MNPEDGPAIPKSLQDSLLLKLKQRQDYGDSVSAVIKKLRISGTPITAENICAGAKVSKKNAALIEAAVHGYEAYVNEFGPFIKEKYGSEIVSFAIVGGTARGSGRGHPDIDIFIKVRCGRERLPDQKTVYIAKHKGKKYLFDVLLDNFHPNSVLANGFVFRSLAGAVLRVDDSFELAIKKARSHIKVQDLYFLKKREVVNYLSNLIKKSQKKSDKQFNYALGSIDSLLHQVLDQNHYFGSRQFGHIMSSLEKNSRIIHFRSSGTEWAFFKRVIIASLFAMLKFYIRPREKETLKIFNETKERIKAL